MHRGANLKNIKGERKKELCQVVSFFVGVPRSCQDLRLFIKRGADLPGIPLIFSKAGRVVIHPRFCTNPVGSLYIAGKTLRSC